MKNYLDLLHDALYNGTLKDDRTGVGRISIFGRMLRFDLAEGFPIVTTRKINFKTIVVENLWFLSGSTNTRFLTDNGVNIWTPWATESGEIGPMYGAQLRPQLDRLMAELEHNPSSRRHVMTTWSPGDLPFEKLSPQANVNSGRMALAPCHGVAIQFDVTNGKLSCAMYQRSADIVVGVPHNIAGYALLTHMIAQQLGLKVGDLVIMLGDAHIYANLVENARRQLCREPKLLPYLKIKRHPYALTDYTLDDFELEDYEYHPAIKQSVAV